VENATQTAAEVHEAGAEAVQCDAGATGC